MNKFDPDNRTGRRIINVSLTILFIVGTLLLTCLVMGTIYVLTVRTAGCFLC